MLGRTRWFLAALLLLVSTRANAQGAPAAPPSLGSSSTPGVSSPNLAMLATGLLTLSVAYVPAVVVAGQSPQSVDADLFIPVAGPWLDLGDRPGCGRGPGLISCRVETGNMVMLAIDGLFQTWGFAAAVASFFAHEYERPSLRVAPAKVGIDGYGLSALGSF